jgi:maltose alpha-D-glucosyltransferase/alpha-amylase
MDLVCNHISDQHEWFQKAENGDEYYRNFFFYSKDKPEYVRSFNNEFGKYAEYIVDGKPKEVYIVFPDTVGEIPHWRQGKDGYWYYHTFYPQQPDLNWFNPEVFYEFAKIIIHWSSFGFHFRLDAIPFVGKGIYKDNANDDENTHSIVRGLYHIGRMINPNCALLVETYESTQSVINYFGTTNSPETTLSYNFHLCTNTWLTLVKEDTNYFKECFTSTIAVPIHGEWITFLRNHDELSIAFIDDHLRDSLVETLKPLGAAFREGHAVAGRTFPLLGKNKERTLMAFCLLASFPGSLGIMYGDEIAMDNVPMSELTETQQKDTRNINRGLLKFEAKDNPDNKWFFEKMSDILNKRRFVSYYMNIEPTLGDENTQVLTARYKHGISELLVFINITGKEIVLEPETERFEPVLTVNSASCEPGKVILGPYGCIWLQR